MTNRPRRSRPTKKSGATIDLQAEKKTSVTTGSTNKSNDMSNIDPGADDRPAAATAGRTAEAVPADPVKGPVSAENDAGAAPSDAVEDDAASPGRAEDAGRAALGGSDFAEADLAGGDTSQPLSVTPADLSETDSGASTTDDGSKDEGFGSTASTGSGDWSREAGDDERTGGATSLFAAEEGLDPDAGHPPLEESERESEKDRATMLAAAAPAAGTTGASYPSASASPGDGDAGAGTFDPAYAGTGSRQDGGGFGRALAAAVLGAVIALGGAAALQYAGVLPAAGSGGDETQQVAASDGMQQLSAELAALQGEVEELRSAPAAGEAAEGAGAAELAALGERLTAVEQAGQDGGAAGDAAAAAQASADEANTAAAGAQETATAAGAAAETARTEAAAAAATATQAQQGATAAQATAAQAQQTAAEAQQTALNSQESAAAALAAAEAAQATAAQSAGTLQDFEQRLAAIETANREAATALAAANLKSAIDRGGPFMGQLESYAAASGSPEAVETLRAYAADGVPSAAELRAAWPDNQDRILAALAPVPSDAPVGEQVLSGLRSLVTVRPAGPAPETAEGPQAAVSRLDAAVESGDFATWLTEWQSLPQAAKDVSQQFASRVEARVSTNRIVDQALDGAIQPAAAGTQG